MDIHIQVVSKEEIKLRKGFTGADWWFDYWGNLQIRIEKMKNPQHEIALSIHEMEEALYSKLLGITVKQVDDFDEGYEKTHADNHGLNAGDAPGCPYAIPHSLATSPERTYAAMAGICWEDYDKEVGDL
jgi:hypothetical protein